MTPRAVLFIALLALLLQTGSVHAHHAFSPVYDGAKTVTITGTLTDFKLVNPHAMMTIDVADKTGKHVVWMVEMPGLLSLTRLGWTEKTVAVGDRLTVSGNPTHTGSARVAFKKIVLANGTELLDPREDSASTVEEQRRERARQRQQRK
jgi:hypothetical protein